MAVSITDLNVTEDYADDTKLTEAQLNDAMTSIETHVNTKVDNNLVQLARDCFGDANYSFGDDGVATKTNTLFEKQYAYDSYNSGDISIGTAATVAWADVDAVNASVSITPETAGVYEVTFNFTHRAVTTATTEGELDIGFRLTDGSTTSQVVNSGAYMAATAANNGEIIHPVSITMYFDWASTTAKTILLQYYNRSCTAINSNVVAASGTTGEIGMIVRKI